MSPLSSAECFAHIYMGETTAVYWQGFSQTCLNQPFFTPSFASTLKQIYICMRTISPQQALDEIKRTQLL